MAKIIYAVYRGYDKTKNAQVDCQMYDTWDQAKAVVHGVSKKVQGISPVYKKCFSIEEAEQYFQEHSRQDSLRNKSHLDFPQDTFHLYTDGSYSKELEKYSSGLVLLQGEKMLLEYKLASKDNTYKQYQQIPGELKAAILGLKIALKYYQPKHIVIYYDYMGVKNHAVGEWDRDNQLSKDYYQWFQDFMMENDALQIDFIKVDAHTGNEYNERADQLAKEALKEINHSK